MSLGLIIPQRASMFGVGTVRELLDLAPVAEQSGLFDTVWVGDSLTSKSRPEALACLGVLAGITSGLRPAVGCLASFAVRDPALFACQWASLDAVSGGRTLLAVCNGPQKKDAAPERVRDEGATHIALRLTSWRQREQFGLLIGKGLPALLADQR